MAPSSPLADTPNFFCKRPAKFKGGPAQRSSDGNEGIDSNQNGDGEYEPPRLAFVQAIVDHHTRARDLRDNRARLEASTNAWYMPMPGSSSARRDPSPPKEANTSLPPYASSSSSSSSAGTSSIISHASHSHQASESGETSLTAPSASPPRSEDAKADDATDSQKSDTAPSIPPQEPDEAPWFSQLASLPHLRSAGIPLFQPSSTQGPLPTLLPASSSKLKASTPAPQSTTFAHDAPSFSEEDLHPLQPPDNFAMVNSWLYRSSFPKKKHFPFLRTIGLKSVLTLILEEYPEQNTKFLDEEGITFFQFGIPGNKEPFVQSESLREVGALLHCSL